MDIDALRGWLTGQPLRWSRCQRLFAHMMDTLTDHAMLGW
jgi:hypothetical protein